MVGHVTPPTVRDAVLDVLRERSLTRLFANPGSTEVPFLTHLPEDLEFVLALHESSVVGMATGYALGRARPAIALLHTTAGFGNAVGALATARVNRAPLVVLVGQQDRRHLAHVPFLAGRLAGLAGEYPVWVDQPVRPQDLPGSIDRAFHEAETARGPAVVIAPMDDWSAPADDPGNRAAPRTILRATAADPDAIGAVVAMLADAERPALVVGSGADVAATCAALVLMLV
jgi:benzoylformate decarboxylase